MSSGTLSFFKSASFMLAVESRRGATRSDCMDSIRAGLGAAVGPESLKSKFEIGRLGRFSRPLSVPLPLPKLHAATATLCAPAPRFAFESTFKKLQSSSTDGAVQEAHDRGRQRERGRRRRHSSRKPPPFADRALRRRLVPGFAIRWWVEWESAAEGRLGTCARSSVGARVAR